MAINTDTEFERRAIADRCRGEGGGGEGAAEFRDTHKLIAVVVKDGVGSCSDSRRPSVKSLKSLSAEQNSCKSPPSSPAPGRIEPEPRSYMWLALFSCFCPALPLNVIALYFSHASRSMTQANDFDGARRLGRRSLLFSIMAIAVGLSIILYLAITES